jgi:hypothetical protein
MLCGGCGYRFRVDLAWIDRWSCSQEECPQCGLTCEHEDAPRVTLDPDEPALDDDHVARLYWYHTSTHPDWPRKDFDPAASLTEQTRRMMGGAEHVAAWAARQKAKALHVGTYEAAIHNMLRRMDDQADSRSHFYLYRVRLRPGVVVREGWLIDPSNFVGDVNLAEVCSSGIDVARYLNYHEDPGALSLALGRGAIQWVQRIPLPLPPVGPDDWIRSAVTKLKSTSDVVIPAVGKLARFWKSSSARVAVGRELGGALSIRLPVNLRRQFESAVAFEEGDDPTEWAYRAIAVLDLIEDPQHVLEALDDAECRRVCETDL